MAFSYTDRQLDEQHGKNMARPMLNMLRKRGNDNE